MEVFAGISLNDDLINFSFAALKAGALFPCLESFRPMPKIYSNLNVFLDHSIDDINQEIAAAEDRFSFKVEKVYFKISNSDSKKITVEDVIALTADKRGKKISHKDIEFAKKHVENTFLDWNDCCIHHIVLGYEIDGVKYLNPPLGLWARKLKIRSLIISVDNLLYDKFCNLFDNFERKFQGFIYEPLAGFGSIFNSQEAFRKDFFIFYIGRKTTLVVSFLGGNSCFEKIFNFGENEIVRAVADKFSLTNELAQQIIFQYASFRGVSSSKEISIKDKDSYLHLSSLSLNSYIKDLLAKEIEKIISFLADELAICAIKDTFTFSFIGRIPQIDGFLEFIKKNILLVTEVPFNQDVFSLGFGSINYGIFRYLEQNFSSESFMKKVLRMYKEYF